MTAQHLKDLDSLRTAAMEVAYALQDEVTGRRQGENRIGGEDVARAMDRIARTVRQTILLERRILGLDAGPRERDAAPRGPSPDPAASQADSAPASPDRPDRAERLDDDILDDFSDLDTQAGLIADMDDDEIRAYGWKDRAEALVPFKLGAQATIDALRPTAAADPMTAAEANALIRAKHWPPLDDVPPNDAPPADPARQPKPAPARPAKTSKAPGQMSEAGRLSTLMDLADRYEAASTQAERTRLQQEIAPLLAAARDPPSGVPPPA
ncbi:hypothetical protein [Zavarzinia sp. CC-PAN008]|uniref:hypothetical protein n=1 Tax=Zavarzinia sp. CC-PAN008 TaxID=3243332 RepID=UPI003F747ABC